MEKTEKRKFRFETLKCKQSSCINKKKSSCPCSDTMCGLRAIEYVINGFGGKEVAHVYTSATKMPTLLCFVKKKSIYLESWVFEINLVNILDFEAICKVAHDVKIPVTVDNTSLINLILYIGRYFINPIEHGADIVYNRLWNNNRGIMIDGSKSPWNNRGFPIFTNPSSDHHGLIYWDIFGYNVFTMKARFEALSLRVHIQAGNVLELEKWSESRDGDANIGAAFIDALQLASHWQIYEHIDDIKEDFTIAFEKIEEVN
ncbi:unnamed protein product [Rhizophagus irregularis]|nr:unnamed protein product [Rhizophagus irregularis]